MTDVDRLFHHIETHDLTALSCLHEVMCHVETVSCSSVVITVRSLFSEVGSPDMCPWTSA